MTRRVSRPALAGALLLGLWPAGAQALPRFAQKENKPCAFCHVKPSGGGKRNAAGHWYEEHGFSFRGYVPPQKLKPASHAAKSAAGKPNKPNPKNKRK